MVKNVNQKREGKRVIKERKKDEKDGRECKKREENRM